MPGFNQQPKDTIIQSVNQMILCEAKGQSPLKITWLKNEQLLDIKKLQYLSKSQKGSLTIYNTQRTRDEGKYRCIVQNQFGTVLSESAWITFPCKYMIFIGYLN